MASAPLRFDSGTRYGAALAGVLFAAYLNIATDFNTYIVSSNYAGSFGTDVPVVNFLQFALIVVLYVVSFSIMPTSSARRLGAVTLACTVLFLWAALGIERGVGNIQHPVQFWFVVLNQGFITIVVALGGWVIARGRHWISWSVVLLAFVPPIVARVLDDAAVTSGSYTLVIEGVVVITGVVGAWLAWLIDRLVRRRRARPASLPLTEATPAL